MNRMQSLLLRLLRVPTEPCIPAGAREVRVFRAAPNYYRYRVAVWVLVQLGTLAGLITGILVLGSIVRSIGSPVATFLFRGGEILAWAGFIGLLPARFLIVRLDFDLRWYILSDRSLRIREGILSLREKTMTYANVQQITIRQNPIQRLLGIADVQVRSAGGGAGASGDKAQMGESMHEAWFRGVADPEEIRSAIQERVRHFADAGLGDPDETRPPLVATTSRSPGAIPAAREVLHEVRALRRALDPHPPVLQGAIGNKDSAAE